MDARLGLFIGTSCYASVLSSFRLFDRHVHNFNFTIKKMAHTIEEVVMNIADKHSTTVQQYRNYKRMLWELVDELTDPVYLDKLAREDYRYI